MLHARLLGQVLKSPNSTFLVVGCVLGLNAIGLLAQETPSATLLTVDHYLDFETVGDPQISPDGSQVVYARRWVNQMEDSFESAIWIMDIDGSRNRFLLEGSSPAWAPDGTRIAYLAEAEPERNQIFVRWMDAEGAVSQITHETETPSNIKWSPDGRSIYFQSLVPEKQSWPIDLPAAPEGATWTEAPRMIDRIHFRMDRIGFLPEGNTHLFRVPADGGTARQLTKGDWMVGASFVPGTGSVGYSITPDGETVILDGLVTDDTDAHYRETHIYSLDLDSGDVTQLTQIKGPWAGPSVSPDGRQIAFTGFDWTSQTYKTGELYVMAVDGSGVRQISDDLDRDVGSLEWSSDSRGVYFTTGDRGTQNVHYAPVDGDVRQVTQGTHMLTLSSVADGGRAVGLRTSPHAPADVVTYDLRRPADIRQLTHVNDDVLEGIRLGEVEEIWYESTGNTEVQGWIVKPPDFDPSKGYPLILHIHGGPYGMYNVGFSYPYQNYAANGYVVLYNQPAGEHRIRYRLRQRHRQRIPERPTTMT